MSLLSVLSIYFVVQALSFNVCLMIEYLDALLNVARAPILVIPVFE